MKIRDMFILFFIFFLAWPSLASSAPATKARSSIRIMQPMRSALTPPPSGQPCESAALRTPPYGKFFKAFILDVRGSGEARNAITLLDANDCSAVYEVTVPVGSDVKASDSWEVTQANSILESASWVKDSGRSAWFDIRILETRSVLHKMLVSDEWQVIDPMTRPECAKESVPSFPVEGKALNVTFVSPPSLNGCDAFIKRKDTAGHCLLRVFEHSDEGVTDEVAHAMCAMLLKATLKEGDVKIERGTAPKASGRDDYLIFPYAIQLM
jgi:hypothetical protein